MSTTGTTRAVLYLRVSVDATGERLAVDRQRDECQRIAELRGWHVVAEYVDNSMSASAKRKARPGYESMVDAYAAGQFDALVCWDLDRLTRQPRQLEDWVDAAEDRGLRLVTANGEADLSTDGGRMYARIKIAVARAEIERKSARRRLANAQRAERGLPMSGAQLTGYRTQNGITTTVPTEAEAVREMFRRFAAGDSIHSLAQWLNGPDGLPTRFGRPWLASSVRGMLTNPRYAGRMVYRGKVVPEPGKWEPLVDAVTFDVIQAKLGDPRRRTQNGTDRKHLGSGLYLCGVCEQPVSAFSGLRYRCRAAHSNRSQGPVDNYVRAVIRERLSRPDLADLVPEAEDEDAGEAAKALGALRGRLALIEQDYDAGHIDGRRYAVATQKVEAEIEAAQATAVRASGNRGLQMLRGTDPVAAFDDAPLMLQRSIVDALCVVRLYPAPRGRKEFDPATVGIDWRTS